ncbi:hypothetical protein K435DRAFT_488482 [Dendrothele bispora CBS 962.96]|uniref:Uncharacterized protein n=1 Tax=Dendrothele bispora (strain CBS 962.96) TaxID=1314807 RepID=A0A4S8MB30_DENBC|nr:hypothetical protein K435DRAFT_488482 [Dendrothele bispora CBS 962.96]
MSVCNWIVCRAGASLRVPLYLKHEPLIAFLVFLRTMTGDWRYWSQIPSQNPGTRTRTPFSLINLSESGSRAQIMGSMLSVAIT